MEDSVAFRAFARLEMGVYLCKSILQDSIKSLGEATWEALHQLIVGYAAKTKVETGKKVRIDSMAIDIHHPTDSSLFWDGIRIMTRWIMEGHQLRARFEGKSGANVKLSKSETQRTRFMSRYQRNRDFQN